MDASVTLPELPNYAVATLSGNSSVTGTSYTDVISLSVTITTNGRPVQLCIFPSNADSYFSQNGISSSSSENSYIRIIRDGSTVVSEWVVRSSNSVTQIPPSMIAQDFPVAGTYTYKVQFKRSATVSTLATFSNVKFSAVEL